MNNSLFLKGNKQNQCLFVNNKNVITLKTDNPDEIIKNGNKILSGDDISDNKDVKSIIDFLHSQNVSKEQYRVDFFNSVDYLKKSSNKKKKIVLIDQKSPNEILQLFTKKYRNTSFIINFQGDIVVIPILNGKTLCQQCVVRRYFNANGKLYKYKQLWKAQVNPIDKKLIPFLRLLAEENIDKHNNILMLDKTNYIVKESKCMAYEGCKICFYNENNIKTEKVELVPNIVHFKENGSRCYFAQKTDQIMSELVNPLGPVISLENDQSIDKLNMPVYQSEIGTDPLIKTFNYHGGKGRTSLQAKFSAIGEAMERYNAQQFGNEIVITQSFKWMKKHYPNVIDPREFLIDDEYPIPYNENLLLDWTLVKNLSNNMNYYVPSNCVFFVYHPTKKASRFIPQETTGLASGMNVSEAVLQGMLEIIERDAYTIYYRNQIKPVTVDISSIKDKEIQEIIYNLENHDIKIHLKYLRNDTGVCVIHCVTEDLSKNLPIYTHGAGASLDPTIAVSRAITECIQLRVSQMKILKNEELFKNDPEYTPYISWGKGNFNDVSVFLDDISDCKISMNKLNDLSSKNINNDISYIINKLRRIGYKVLVANLSRHDNPISTVRVLIPGFQPADDTLRRVSKRMLNLPKFLNTTVSSNLFERPLFS